MRAEAMHGTISADCAVGAKVLTSQDKILIVIGKAFTMHVNARSSYNHDPNFRLFGNVKFGYTLYSEQISSPCEHSVVFLQCYLEHNPLVDGKLGNVVGEEKMAVVLCGRVDAVLLDQTGPSKGHQATQLGTLFL